MAMEGGNLFLAVMYGDKEALKNSIEEIEKNIGAVFFRMKEYDFNFTDYYESEFGSNLKKTICVFGIFIEKHELAEAKILCSQIEADLAREDGKRTVNIDPGYFNEKEVVLASFKKKDFKEEMGESVFAHKVLEFDGIKVNEFFHTFPDFRSKDVKDFFLNLLPTGKIQKMHE